MAKSHCRFCGVKDEVSNLVEVCGCHKKSDNALCHKGCLESYIARSTQSEDDAVSYSAKHCPTCKQPFQVKLRWRWSSERYYTGVSLGQCFNLAMIVMTSLGFFASVKLVLESDDAKTKKVRSLIWFLFAVVVVMTIFVFRRVYDRWRRIQIEPELVEEP